MHPRDNGLVRPATDEEASLLSALKDVEEKVDRLSQAADKMRNRLRLMLEESAGIDCNLAKVSYRSVKGRTGIDRKKLEAGWPDVARQCLTTGKPSRQLRITYKEAE